MLDSIAELKNGVQKAETFAQSALEETFEELNKNAQKTFQYLAPSKRMILHKTGERVQDGVNGKLFFNFFNLSPNPQKKQFS